KHLGSDPSQTPNTKHQAPEKFQCPNPKRTAAAASQIGPARSEADDLQLGIWSFFGVWSLELGLSTLELPSSFPVAKPGPPSGIVRDPGGGLRFVAAVDEQRPTFCFRSGQFRFPKST